MENWVASIIESLGYFGVAFLMFVENLFPPIPSEVIMPLAGYISAKGQLSIVLVIIAGTFGSVLGAIFWYFVARWLGAERLRRWARRHGRWITLGTSDIDKAEHWFERHGVSVIFFGRLVPTIRTVVAIPAGLFGMKLGRYLLFTALGSVIWTGALALIGWWLGSKWTEIEAWMDPFTYVVMTAVLLIYLYRVVTFQSTEKKAEDRRATGRR